MLYLNFRKPCWAKGENVGYKHFLFFSFQCLPETAFSWLLYPSLCGKGENGCLVWNTLVQVEHVGKRRIACYEQFPFYRNVLQCWELLDGKVSAEGIPYGS